MSIQPGVGYSVSNLGNVSSLSIDTIMPEAEPKQFECSIVRKSGETPEYHLRVRRGLIEFDYFQVDENGFLGEKWGVYNTDLSYGQQTNVTLCYLYAPNFNLYPENTRVVGANANTSEFLSDGYIKLEEGENYFVFVYKVTPQYPFGMPPLPGPSTNEHCSPQIAVMKAGEDFINAGDESNGSGTLIAQIQQNEFYAARPMGTVLDMPYGAGTAPAGISANGLYAWYNPVVQSDGLNTLIMSEDENGVQIKNITNIKVLFKETSCIRKDIAYIKWNAGLKRFQIFQINYGPISIRQQPIGPISYSLEGYGWGGGKNACKDITDPIDGYQKSLNGLYQCSAPAFINENLYQKPYENS